MGKMEICYKCQRSERAVKLLDAIYGSEIVKICEECAVSENIPIIRKPTSFQLNESEKPYTVRERLSKMAGIPLKKPVAEEIKPKVTLDNLRKPKDYSKIIEDRWQEAKKKNKPLDLIDNWNWHIQMARRDRKLSLSQIGSVTGESELSLKLIEQGSLPDDANKIIGKLEQFFKISLRKSEAEKEIERIEEAKQPARILSFDSESMKNLTISDLRRMKQEREKEEKQDENKAEKGLVGSDVEFSDD